MLIAWLLAAAVIGASSASDPPGGVPAAGSAAASTVEQETPAKAQKPKKEKKQKKKRAAADEPAAPDETIDPDAVDTDANVGHGLDFSWKQHPSIRFGSAFQIEFEAKFQEDGHQSYDGAVANGLARWELHRNRVGIKGKLFKHIEFEVERELTEKELTEKEIAQGLTPNPQWKDVNVNLTYFKKAQIQIGKFKVPFGLDELTSVTHNDFVYRSLGANYLAPGRDIGVGVHASFFKHGLEYSTGVFIHDGDNARSKKIEGGNTTLAARVDGTPFRNVTLSSLGRMVVGTSFAISNVSDDSFRPNGLRGRTVMTQDTFYETVYVKGHRRRWAADADWAAGRVSARGELTWVSDDRLAQGIGDQDLPNARARAWFFSGTYVLTDDDKKRPIKPVAPFLQGGIGSVELAARYERMWFDSADAGTDPPFRNPRAETIYPSGDKVLTLGVNWTLNRWVKVQLNGIREHVEDPDRNPVPNGAAFWSRVLRLQFVL